MIRRRVLVVVASVCFVVGLAMGGLSAGQRTLPQTASALTPALGPLPTAPEPTRNPAMPLAIPVDGCTAESRPIASAIASVSAAHQSPPCDVASVVVSAAKKYGIDPYLVIAVGQTESSWRLKTRGPKGEWGPMQVMPATAREMGATDLQDWRQTTEAGIRYLSSMIDRANGDLSLALAYYNAGPSRGEKLARLYSGDYPGKVMQLYEQIKP